MRSLLAKVIGHPEVVDLPPDKCIFCRIIAGHHTDNKSIIYEDDTLVVFPDIRPAGVVHLQVVPKRHIINVNSLRSGNQNDYELGTRYAMLLVIN